MAVYKIFASKDATLYSQFPDMNTGLDEILEIKNTKGKGGTLSRAVIYFDLGGINDIVGDNAYESFIKLYVAKVTGLNANTRINFHPIISNWDNGTGKYLDNRPTTDGVSWNFNWEEPGGDYISTPNTFYPFELKKSKDINLNVTTLVHNQIEEDNQGFLLKLDDNDELKSDINFTPEFQFFSSDTHTIYPPCLEIKWDDSKFSNDNNLPEVTNSDIYVGLNNNKGEFFEGSSNKFRVNVRPKYPIRTYQTSSIYTNNYILPDESCYSIKDLDTNEYIIDFDSKYTKLSCDSQGNYFILHMNGLQPERNYEVLIKTKIEDEILIISNKLYFKIKRNIN